MTRDFFSFPLVQHEGAEVWACLKNAHGMQDPRETCFNNRVHYATLDPAVSRKQ